MCHTVFFTNKPKLGFLHAFCCCLFVCSLKLNTEHLSNPQLHSFTDSIKLSSHVEDTLRSNW